MRTINPEQQAARRRHILEAAMTCFARKGFRGTTTNEICKEAGMSSGNLFHYFPSKLALIEAIAHERRRVWEERFEQIEQADDMFQAIEKSAMDLLRDISRDKYPRVNVEILAEQLGRTEMGNFFTKYETQSREQMKKIIQKGIANGQMDKNLDVEAASTWLMTLYNGIIATAGREKNFRVKTYGPMLIKLIRGFLSPTLTAEK